MKNLFEGEQRITVLLVLVWQIIVLGASISP